MSGWRQNRRRLLAAALGCLATAGLVLAQRPGRVELSGVTHPLAQVANDLGPADDSLVVSGSLRLRQAPLQQAALEALLERMQDPSSADYRRWLTPEEFGERFGAGEEEAAAAADWLRREGLTVLGLSRGRTRIAFRGAARRVEAAFGVSLRTVEVDGERHFANQGEPSVPEALAGVVRGVSGLHNFRPKPRYTSPTTGRNNLAPDDVAIIYNLKPLYAAGINGSGQKVAVVGQSRISLADVQQFRAAYNLPPADPQVVLTPNLPDPGVVAADQTEAHLDVEWTGAVARNASIIYVFSENVLDAVEYAVDANLAPVISMSYGLCEQQISRTDLGLFRTLAQQAAAQGITWLNASGDAGAADCFSARGRTLSPLAVDVPASIPEVTGVGGTQFNEGSGTYWNRTNDTNQASAISYIPEAAWNDSTPSQPSASGGGVSTFYPRPSWQTGAGLAGGAFRLVPDVSLSASPSHVGYLFVTGGRTGVVGGTSASAPVFAGMVSLLNQYQVANGLATAVGMGNINPQLYVLAQRAPGAFHDTLTGDNKVNPCEPRATACSSDPIGYDAGPGYDMATGLGSVDGFALITAWGRTSTSGKSTATVVSSAREATLSYTGSTVLTATVSGLGGVTPTGSVTFLLGTAQLGNGQLSGTGGTATATYTVSGVQLTPGTVAITARYSGDGNYDPASSAAFSLRVLAPTALTIGGVSNAASFRTVYAPGMILAVFGALLADTMQSPATLPLPTAFAGVSVTVNGVGAPIYYVSPTQLNVQIPYGTPAGTAAVRVSFGGQSATTSVTIAAASPGIFATPVETVRRGSVATLYVTGQGALVPQPATGSIPLPGATPTPVLPVKVTVGEMETQISYVGVPGWSIGVLQINYTVPLNTPFGTQPVVVTVGGAASPASSVNVAP